MSKPDLSGYFTSVEAFQPLRKKVLDALKGAKSENRSEEEIAILRALSKVTDDEHGFLHSLRSLIIQFDSEAVQRCVQGLVDKKKVVIAIQVTDAEKITMVSIESPLKTPNPSIQKERAMLIAARMMRNKRIDPLENEEEFQRLVMLIQLTPREERGRQNWERRLAEQILITNGLLDRQMPLKEARERSLGEDMLNQIISEEELKRATKSNPAASRKWMLDGYIERILTREKVSTMERLSLGKRQISNGLDGSEKIVLAVHTTLHEM